MSFAAEVREAAEAVERARSGTQYLRALEREHELVVSWLNQPRLLGTPGRGRRDPNAPSRSRVVRPKPVGS